ncbi:hypothetical protein [Halobacillus sp. K22]|uniref:hypothetical protein n=1 Tax=Halobacillus sp. K22 TaxID=3457431 RepID=UPI003FCD11A5
MKFEKKNQYFFMALGHLGMILVALGAMRVMSVINDSAGFAFTFFGFLLMNIYINDLEKKMGFSKKEKGIFTSIFIIIFIGLSLWLYLL